MQKPSVRPGAHLMSPALIAVNTLARHLLGVDLMIVYPTHQGWTEGRPGTQRKTPEFCRLVMGSRDGAKHCRMCHIMLSVAAASSGVGEQRCQAGACVLVAPVATPGSEAHAILTSCLYAGPDAEPEVRMRAEKLGINANDLIAAFRALHTLPEEKVDIARMVLNVAQEACHESASRHRMESVLSERSMHCDKPSAAVEAFEQAVAELRVTPDTNPDATPERTRTPHTIRLVARLITERPYLPFTVNELAAASRLTRNHFSTLFHAHVGTNFSAFLTERRMAHAMELLRDPTLNISEVARRSGYGDPGYFARRFHQEIGLAPRDWRRQCVSDPTVRGLGAS